MILQTLYQNCVKHGVEFFNEFYVLDLLMTDGRRRRAAPSGVVAYELATGELHVFQAKAVIFATGGFGKIFKTTSNAHTLTGDGVGIVWRKGLPLEDMEFFQFHPTGLAGLGILLSEARPRRGRHPAQRRRRALHGALRPDHQGPRAARHRRPLRWPTRSREGRGAGPQQGLRAARPAPTSAPRYSTTKLPDITEFARTYLGVEPVHRAGAGHARPRTTRWAASRPTSRPRCWRNNTDVVPGLYAAGECACVSVHGSNRLGTNSLLDINVFGTRAGIARRRVRRDRAVRRRCPTTPRPSCATLVEEHAHPRPAPSASPTCARSCRTTMDRNAQVFRTEESLKQALDVIDGAASERYANVVVQDKGKRFNTDLLEAVELGFLLDLAEVVVVSAR